MTPEHSHAARELLAFYAEAGVDALLGEEPMARLAAAQTESAPAVPERAVEAPRITPPRPAIPESASAAPEVAVMAAREAGRSAARLHELRDILLKFEGCALRTTAKQQIGRAAGRERG